ncbi:hypothetical protein Mal4_00900 [Maioricimonas rarisocia]|uniref:Uncharacterized protein n=2 Tax=Maioricimonas rarisocia TaxID=2528026 RepID=A0A517YZZ6_9PLAN|nr:hypothetical protein Mal4_00900 [Maioricimonas rarisocia]
MLGAMLAGGIVGCCGQARQCGTHDPCAAECVATAGTPCVGSGHHLPATQYSPRPVESDPAHLQPPADAEPVLPSAPEPTQQDLYPEPVPESAPPPPPEMDEVPPPPPLPGFAKSRLRPGSGRGNDAVDEPGDPDRPRGLLYRLPGAPKLFSPSTPPPVEEIAREVERRPMPSKADGPVEFRSPAEMRMHQTVSAHGTQPVTLLPPEPVVNDAAEPLPAPRTIPVEHTFGHVLP